MNAKLAASVALTVAVAATFASGAHWHLLTTPAKRIVKLDRPLPTVTPNAIEAGCAAWGEALADCVTRPAPDAADFPAGEAPRF